MVAPLLAGAGKILGSAVAWTGASAALKKAGPWVKTQASKLGGWIKGNPGPAAKGGLGIGALATVRSTLSDLGVKNNQLQLAVIVGLALAAVAAVGQLFDVQIGGN